MKPRVVILGAGFAGLQAAKVLRNRPVQVTLIDRHNYHLFQPLLYQVATAALQPAEIAGPIRQIVRAPNVDVLLGEVRSIDCARRAVVLDDREVDYDYLLIATGATHSYFGHDEWERHAPGLKTLEDAAEMRRRIILAFEAAERERDPVRQREWLTFVVIGGGPTGVELAGALAEIARQTNPLEFKHFDPRAAKVILVEGLPHVLSTYPVSLSLAARRALEKKGVEVRTDMRVTDVGADYVVAGAERIATRTALWAAGVAASPVVRTLGVPLDRAGRVLVTPELNAPGQPEVFVAGDLAAISVHGRPVPGVAPVAMSMGKWAARAILRRIAGEAVPAFDFWDRGTFAVIGRGAAVGNLFEKVRIHGYLAWLSWLAIHITYLVGFRSRLAVLFNWAYAYLTRRRYAQLIVGRTSEPPTHAVEKPRGIASS
ncbi:MAG: NAD(P)/FAD-dependent oxidoreductase [Polyangiales bacterium]